VLLDRLSAMGVDGVLTNPSGPGVIRASPLG
jgi:hypothetical protein